MKWLKRIVFTVVAVVALLLVIWTAVAVGLQGTAIGTDCRTGGQGLSPDRGPEAVEGLDSLEPTRPCHADGLFRC